MGWPAAYQNAIAAGDEQPIRIIIHRAEKLLLQELDKSFKVFQDSKRRNRFKTFKYQIDKLAEDFKKDFENAVEDVNSDYEGEVLDRFAAKFKEQFDQNCGTLYSKLIEPPQGD